MKMPAAGRTPKFKGGKTTHERKRNARVIARKTIRWKGDKSKEPLAQPLTIAPAAERKTALA